MSKIKFTKVQDKARKLIAQFAFIMLFGGSRSGKTFLAVYAICVRAIKTPQSRHAIFRFRFNAVKNSIVYDTFPKVMKLAFPNVEYRLNKTDWVAIFPNGSEIWFAGLDDKERTEKILGMEFVTIYPNECSQISWESIGMVMTRLAQKCYQVNGDLLDLRMIFDCNPPDKNHWTYKIFIQGLDPDSKKKLPNPEDYGHVQMNPRDNQENLPDAYLKTLENLPPHLKKRFYDGEFKDANPNAIFSEQAIDRWRVEDMSEVPELVRVVVGVDPSGVDDDNTEGHDAVGIYVGALAADGNAYLLEDATVKAGPNVWGKMAVSTYHRHDADLIVGEQNFGGAMVKFVIKASDPNVNYKIVTASRGKVQRAEPFSPLFEDGRVRVVGRQNDLEEELGGFSTHGYTGAKSPNVADAAFWVLAELFPSVVGTKKKKEIKLRNIKTKSIWK